MEIDQRELFFAAIVGYSSCEIHRFIPPLYYDESHINACLLFGIVLRMEKRPDNIILKSINSSILHFVANL